VATRRRVAGEDGARELPPNGDEMVFIHPKKKTNKNHEKKKH
jgi:hypothetical protein